MNLNDLVEPITALAIEAGQAIMAVYATDFDVQAKGDDSPLTQADLASHRRIVAGLEALTPDVPIISEESGLPPFEERSQWPRYWLIDPLDGTKEFVNRNGEFTVNIAFIESHRPVFGVVHVPVQHKTYIGCEGRGTELRAAGTPPVPLHVASAIASAARNAAIWFGAVPVPRCANSSEASCCRKKINKSSATPKEPTISA